MSDRDRQKTEAQIIDAVARLLGRKGFAALGINAIAREAGAGFAVHTGFADGGAGSEDLARAVVERDRKLDDMQREIERKAIRLIALRQPVANDLRAVIAALKISGDLERIGDHCTNIAEEIHFLVTGEHRIERHQGRTGGPGRGGRPGRADRGAARAAQCALNRPSRRWRRAAAPRSAPERARRARARAREGLLMATRAGTSPGALHVVVISPEQTVFEGRADAVVAPAWDGEVGILRGHAPLMAVLGTGEIRITRAGTVERFNVEGGFLQVVDNVVTVLSERAG